MNAVAPGYVPRPELLEVSPPSEEMMAVQQPMFEQTQVPDDPVGTIVFLAGPGSDFITGPDDPRERRVRVLLNGAALIPRCA